MNLPYPQGLIGTALVRICATVTTKDGTTFFRWWSGRSTKGLRAKALATYTAEHPGCTVQFGKALWENSYGAH